MSNSLLMYNQNQDILDKDSTVLPTKKEENLIYDITIMRIASIVNV